MPGHCHVCGSLKIQETCYLCGSLNNNSTLEGGSASGAGDASVQDYRFQGFIMVPIPPSAFHTSLPHSPHPNVTPLSPSPVSSPPRTGVFSYARGELPKQSSSPQFPHSPHPNVSPLSPSPATSGYAEQLPRPHLRRCIFDVLPVASAPRTGVISSSHGDMPTGSPVVTQESPDHERFKTSRKNCRMDQHRDPTIPEDASGDGQPLLKKREIASAQDHRLHGFSEGPVPPPSFYTSLCRTCSDVPVPSPSFYTSLCRSCSDVINSAGLELSKPSTSQNLPHSPSQATGINPNISPLSPSPANGGSTELPPPRTGVMSSGQGELLKPSSSQNLPSSPQGPRTNPNVSPLSPSPAKGGSAQWPPLPVLRRSVSDLLPLSSLPTTAVIPTGHGDMHIESPVIPQESLDHEMQQVEGSNGEQDEEVSIEKDGEYVRIYMKCPCSKAFQLIVSGNHCYYRLM